MKQWRQYLDSKSKPYNRPTVISCLKTWLTQVHGSHFWEVGNKQQSHILWFLTTRTNDVPSVSQYCHKLMATVRAFLSGPLQEISLHVRGRHAWARRSSLSQGSPVLVLGHFRARRRDSQSLPCHPWWQLYLLVVSRIRFNIGKADTTYHTVKAW